MHCAEWGATVQDAVDGAMGGRGGLQYRSQRLAATVLLLNNRYKGEVRVAVRSRAQPEEEAPSTTGVLRCITTDSIAAPAPPSGLPLVDYWREAGRGYSDADAARVLQVQVQLGGGAVYHYPADQVLLPAPSREDEEVARLLGGRLYDCVCKFDRC